MIVKDLEGNVLENPDMQHGHIELSIESMYDHKEGEEYVYIYFPYTEQRQELKDIELAVQAQTDAAICELYEMMTEEG